MKTLIAALIFLGIGIFLMAFNVIFRHKPFPDSEIGHNKELLKRGITCATDDEIRLWGKKDKYGNIAHTCTGECTRIINELRKEQEELINKTL
ncbi:MAG: hypothetical protein WC140_06640 [Bacteroidales bacterium]